MNALVQRMNELVADARQAGQEDQLWKALAKALGEDAMTDDAEAFAQTAKAHAITNSQIRAILDVAKRSKYGGQIKAHLVGQVVRDPPALPRPFVDAALQLGQKYGWNRPSLAEIIGMTTEFLGA